MFNPKLGGESTQGGASVPEGAASVSGQGLCSRAGQAPPLLYTISVSCHPERSEGSASTGREMLRCAQHDTGGVHGCLPMIFATITILYCGLNFNICLINVQGVEKVF